jgi:hypothetical protein
MKLEKITQPRKYYCKKISFVNFNKSNQMFQFPSQPKKELTLQHSIHFCQYSNIISEEGITLKGNTYKGTYTNPDDTSKDLVTQLETVVSKKKLLFFSGTPPLSNRTRSQYGSICFNFSFDKVLEQYKKKHNKICCIPFGTIKFTHEYCHTYLICTQKFKNQQKLKVNSGGPFNFETRTWSFSEMDDSKPSWERLDVVFVLDDEEEFKFTHEIDYNIILKDHCFCVKNELNCQELNVNPVDSFASLLMKDYQNKTTSIFSIYSKMLKNPNFVTFPSKKDFNYRTITGKLEKKVFVTKFMEDQIEIDFTDPENESIVEIQLQKVFNNLGFEVYSNVMSSMTIEDGHMSIYKDSDQGVQSIQLSTFSIFDLPEEIEKIILCGFNVQEFIDINDIFNY